MAIQSPSPGFKIRSFGGRILEVCKMRIPSPDTNGTLAYAVQHRFDGQEEVAIDIDFQLFAFDFQLGPKPLAF